MSRHTRMKMIEDRLSYIEARLALMEATAEAWFESLPDDERQAVVEAAREKTEDE